VFHQNSLGRNLQPQFYAVVAMPLFHRFIAGSRIDTSKDHCVGFHGQRKYSQKVPLLQKVEKHCCSGKDEQ